MFDDEMIDTVSIEGEPHYRFKPNTIVYAVPVNSKLGQEIAQSKFGIVFHTTYNSLDSGASFGADVSSLRKTPGVWFDDAFFTDDTGIVTLTENEESEVVRLVREADSVNESINYDDLPSAFLNIYINSEIKGGNFLEDPEKSFNGFVNWYSQRVQKKINNLKSEKGRQRASENASQTLQSFNDKKEDIFNIFKVSRLLFEAKNIFIQKYNNAVYNTKHFVDNGSGDLVASNPEGYVAVDHKGNGIKFVDRLEFSRANFAIDKGDKFAPQISEEDEFDIDNEDDDPVVDTDYPKTVAVVPGAFKPPHKGHLEMVRKYSSIADEVVVIISKPTKQGRYLPDGSEITSEDSLAIWKVLLSGISNVRVEISKDHASPITAAYDFVGDEGPLNVGDKVMLGCSTKGGDCKRWAGAEKYVKDGVTYLPNAGVEPTVRTNGEPYSATAFRSALGNALDNRAEIADFVGEENVDVVLDVLGLSTVKEMSAMAGGGVAIGSAPLASGSDKPAKRDKKKKKQKQYIDLGLLAEVMELIIERAANDESK